MKLRKAILALTLAAAAFGVQAATTGYVVDAKNNSTTGGSGLSTLTLTAGQSFSVTVDPTDLWNAGEIPRWSNADGLDKDIFWTSGIDAQVGSYSDGTRVGMSWGSHFQNNLTAPFGTLVGQIGSGGFFKIGTNFSGAASAAGTLKLFYFDMNNIDNTGSITAHVVSVPEPESYALMLAGLGLMGTIARRRSKAKAV